MMKPIRYTPHAQQRMAERKISATDVKIVLQTKAIDVPAGKGRRKATDDVGGKRVSVVYKETKSITLVVTVH